MSSRSKRLWSGVFVVFAIVWAAAGGAGATIHGYTEDFSSYLYRAPGYTSASWDTLSGVLSLPLFSIGDLNSYNTPGSAYHVKLAGNIAYVSDHTGGFVAIDITDPASPELLDTYATPDAAFASDVAGDLAFVAAWSAGLVILDISGPMSILLAGTCDTPGNARAVDVEGHYAYVADMDYGLQVIDISNPASPFIAGNYNTIGSAYDVEVSGDYAYVADYNGGLVVIDVSDPTSPSMVASYSLSTARGIAISGNTAYVANYSYGLYAFDITDPSSLSLLDTYNTPGLCYDVSVDGDYAYIADGSSGGVRFVDISDPSNLTFLYTVYSGAGPLYAVRSGELLYIADAADGLVIKRIASAMPPDPVDNAYAGYFLAKTVISGDYAYTCALSNGIAVTDISDPANINPIFGGPSVPGYDIAVSGDIAYVVSQDYRLTVFDLSDPEYPAQIVQFDVGVSYCWGVDVSGDLLCIAAGPDGLIVVDVSDPSSPVVTGYAYSGGNCEDVTMDGDYVWLSEGTLGVECFDISLPSLPMYVSIFNPPEYVKEVTIDGDYAYLACGYDGLIALDISDPSSPVRLGSDTDHDCRSIVIRGDRAFAAGLYDGYLVYDLSDPESPQYVTRYLPPAGAAYGVAVTGDFAFFSGYELGLNSMRIFDNFYEGLENRAASPDLPATGLEIEKVRLTSAEMGNIAWEFSVDQGASWEAIEQNTGSWTTVSASGGYFRWRAELFASAVNRDESPECSNLALEWLHAPAVIDSIVDVPGDQGGYVRVHFSRSSLDFADEASTPATAYDIYRRVDDPLLAARVLELGEGKVTPAGEAPLAAVSLDGRDFATAGSFPPGVWENVGTVHALQSDSYLALAATEADSSASIPWEAFVITTHTTVPATWYVSPADSGYSVDNIAPAAPVGLAASYNTGSGNQLDWSPSPEEDFQYYNIYRGSDPGFEPGPGSLVGQTASTGWTDGEYDGWGVHYKVTAVDDAGNESPPAAPSTVTGDSGPESPLATFLRQNVPNPFNPATTISFDLAADSRVRLVIYSVKGELVRTLAEGPMEAGSRSIAWDGTDDRGRKVSSGVYFYRLETSGYSMTRKMVLLR